MISPVSLLTAIQTYLATNNKSLLSYGHSDEGIPRIAGRHMTRAREKSRHRMRKASQRRNR